MCSSRRRMVRLVDWTTFVLVFAHSLCDAIGATGELTLRVVDNKGQPQAFRAWVDQDNQRLPPPSLPETVTPYPRDKSFSCDGEFTLKAPEGAVIVHLEKGKAWLPQDLRLSIVGDQKTEKTVVLKRWINLRERGYLSADLHIHFGNNNPRILAQLAAADDLDLIPAFSVWLRGTESEWNRTWPQWKSGASYQTAEGAFVSRNNLEIERIFSSAPPGGSVGASFLYNLRLPVSVSRFDTRYPTDTDLCLLARAISPEVVIDTDKPSWAETAVGAILGVYDTVQVCHNHYHRAQTIPGGWGMIGPLSDTERSLRAPNELFRRTNAHYYAFLNCGIRLGVSGGSAIGVMPVPAGYNRVYARVDRPFTAQKFWQALRKGRSFATSGPMLFLEIAGHRPGDTLPYQSGAQESIPISVELQSIEPIHSIEIVHHGKVIRQLSLKSLSANPVLKSEFTFHHVPTRSGWYAARAIYESPPGQLRQAHTSPVYISVDRKPTASKTDASYLVRWIDQLTTLAQQPERFQSPSDRDEVLATYRRARAAYQRIADQAGMVWGD